VIIAVGRIDTRGGSPSRPALKKTQQPKKELSRRRWWASGQLFIRASASGYGARLSAYARFVAMRRGVMGMAGHSARCRSFDRRDDGRSTFGQWLPSCAIGVWGGVNHKKDYDGLSGA